MRCPLCYRKDKVRRSYIAGKRVCMRCKIRFDIKDMKFTKVIMTQ